LEVAGLRPFPFSEGIAEVECCANLHRRTQGGEVCGMGTPVLHIVFRLLSCSERCVFQLRALLLRADVDWGGIRGVRFGGRECGLGRVISLSLGCTIALRLSHVLCWCVMISRRSVLYSFWCSVVGTLSQSCVSEVSTRPWRRNRLMWLDGGASMAVVS
jgi:hypothetical protein